MAQHDQHITTEQLSAFLDGHLSSGEQTRCDGHLKTCELCRHELADLRQTVALLHALPQPVLPRSFVLPVDTALTSGATRRAQQTLTSARASKPHIWPAYVRHTIQTTSAIAAAIGIVFLLSGLLTMGVGTAMMTVSAPASPFVGSRSQDVRADGKGTPLPQLQTKVPNAPTPAATSAKSQSGKVDTQTVPPVLPISPITILFEMGTSTEREAIGLLLLLLAIAGFFLPIRQRKRKEG